MIRRGRPGVFLWTFVVVVGIILVAPTLILIPMSFSSAKNFAFPPPGYSLRLYTNLVTDRTWKDSIVLSFQTAIMATIFATVLGTAAAFGLMRMSRRVRGAMRAVIVAPIIIPQILIALAVYGTFLELHLNATMRGLVFAQTMIALPFVMIAVLARLQSHDPRLRDAGLGLGAKPSTVFFKITVPMVLPGILSGAILAFVFSFDEFIVALFLQGPYFKTLPVKMYDAVSQQIDPTITAAASIIVVVVSVVILGSQLFAVRDKTKTKGARP